MSEACDTEEEKKSLNSDFFNTKHFRRIIQDEDSLRTVENRKEEVLDTDEDPLISDLTNRVFPELLQCVCTYITTSNESIEERIRNINSMLKSLVIHVISDTSHLNQILF